MKYRLFLVAISLISTQVFSGTLGVPTKDWSWVSAVSAGPIWGSNGKTETFFLTPDIEKTYRSSKANEITGSAELFIGVQNLLTQIWVAQLGLAFASTGNLRLQGVIWDDADPLFENHSYQYKVQHNRIALKGKLLLDRGYWLMPWISASLGFGFNHAHNFTNTPLIFEALPNNNFGSQWTTAFTYSLSVGLQKAFTEHWNLGVAYEFADWGRNGLARASAQTLNTGLRFNHLYTNGILFNLAYIA